MIECNGKKEIYENPFTRAYDAVEYKHYFLGSFFELSSASAVLAKLAFCSVKYSQWWLPCTAGRVPRGPSPCRLDGSTGMSV